MIHSNGSPGDPCGLLQPVRGIQRIQFIGTTGTTGTIGAIGPDEYQVHQKYHDYHESTMLSITSDASRSASFRSLSDSVSHESLLVAVVMRTMYSHSRVSRNALF